MTEPAAGTLMPVRRSARDVLYLADRMERLNVGLGERQKDLTSMVVHGSYGQSAVKFARVMDRESSCVRLLMDNPSTLTEDA